jgi:energy-coupling factor transporter ATP-binding protein EcfA2
VATPITSEPVEQYLELYQMLANHFNLEELQELCFILGVRYDDLTGQTLSAKSLALQTYMERRNQLPQLIDQLAIMRPKVDWSAFIPAEPEADPPFKGLHYFTEADADLFYGREALTKELVAYLSDQRFLAVVGASGSGKSSLVRAGVIPAVRRGEIKLFGQPSNTWPIHIITPGEEPLKALAASLTHHSESVTATKTLLNDLRNDGQSLDLWTYRQLVNQPDSRLLLVVDQFEELFIQCEDLLERELFIDNLVNAVGSGKHGRLTLILTLRADFYAHAVQYESLRSLLETGQKIVGPMNSFEMRQVIEGPAVVKDWHFQPGLVDLILRDLGATANQGLASGVLPLLSHALLETWQRREGRVMTLGGYQSVGGVHQAIATTADMVYADLNSVQQAIARNIFLQLTDLGLGTEYTRRRTRLEDLAPQTGTQEEVEQVLNRLVENRLVTVDSDRAEVTHEALIREWPALRDWLDEDQAGLRIQQQLTADAEAWLELNQDTGALYRGLRLVQAEAWAQDHGDRLSKLGSRFIKASQAAIIAEEQAQAEARRRARRTPVFSFFGGALGFALSFLLAASPEVENQSLLLVLTLLRLVAGGLAGFFLVFLVDLTTTSENRIAWLWGGLAGSLVFALLLYFDSLLRATATNSGLLFAALAGMLWGFPAGLGRVWMRKGAQSWWQIVLVSAILCGLGLMLASQVYPVLADALALTVFLSGALVPLAIFVAAHLADPTRRNVEP